VKTGVQRIYNWWKELDSGFRRNDGKTCFFPFYEFIKFRKENSIWKASRWNPPNPPLEKGVKGDFWDCLDVKIHSSGRNAAELCWYLSVSDIFSQEVIRVHPRPILSFVFKPFANIKSVFICVHLCPKNSSEFVGATRRVARMEFGVKDDRVLFLILGLFYPCPSVSH